LTSLRAVFSVEDKGNLMKKQEDAEVHGHKGNNLPELSIGGSGG
jgi:hypothetical protein